MPSQTRLGVVTSDSQRKDCMRLPSLPFPSSSFYLPPSLFSLLYFFICFPVFLFYSLLCISANPVFSFFALLISDVTLFLSSLLFFLSKLHFFLFLQSFLFLNFSSFFSLEFRQFPSFSCLGLPFQTPCCALSGLRMSIATSHALTDV